MNKWNMIMFLLFLISSAEAMRVEVTVNYYGDGVYDEACLFLNVEGMLEWNSGTIDIQGPDAETLKDVCKDIIFSFDRVGGEYLKVAALLTRVLGYDEEGTYHDNLEEEFDHYGSLGTNPFSAELDATKIDRETMKTLLSDANFY